MYKLPFAKIFFLIHFFFIPSFIQAQTYDENPINEEEQQYSWPEQDSYSWDARSFSVMPADLPNSKITVPDDPISQSFRFFAQALLDEKNNDFDNAISGFKKTIEASPENIYVYQHSAQMALDSGRYADAEKWSEYLVQKDSSTSRNWVLYGNSKWANENYAEAEKAYSEALKLDSDNTEGLFQYASLISEDNPDLAMKFLNRYKKLRPEDSAEIDYRIAILYNIKRNLPKTEEYLLKAVEENPYHSASWYSLIELYEIKKDTASAIAAMEALEASDPGNIAVIKRLAETYLESDSDKADEYFRKIKKIDKADPDACFWLSANAENNEDYEEAARNLEDSASLWARPDLLLRLSFYYTKTGRYEEGVRILEKAYEKFPENNDIAYYAGLGLDDLGNSQKAYSILDLLSRKNPDNTDYRMSLAQVCDKLDKLDEMEKHFKFILEKQPENASVLNYLGYTLADRNIKLEEARQHIEKAVSLSPDDGAYADSLAWVNYRLGNLDKAREEIIRAKNLIADDFVIWDHYGDIFNAAGETGEAWKAWKAAFLSSDKQEEQETARKKIAQSEKRLPPQSASVLRTAYFDKFFAWGKDYSSFGKLEASFGGKKIKLDIMLSFAAPDYLKITFLSPFYTPAGYASVSGEGASFSDLPDIPGIGKYKDSIKSWMGVMLMDLRDFYMGRYNKANLKNWKSMSYVSEYGAKVKLQKSGMPGKIISARNKKIELEINNYLVADKYMFPLEIQFKAPYAKGKIILKPENMKYDSKNDLRSFVKMKP